VLPLFSMASLLAASEPLRAEAVCCGQVVRAGDFGCQIEYGRPV